MVFSSITSVKPQDVVNTDVCHKTARNPQVNPTAETVTLTNWSGVVINSGSPFLDVYRIFFVPAVTGRQERNVTQAHKLTLMVLI